MNTKEEIEKLVEARKVAINKALRDRTWAISKVEGEYQEVLADIDRQFQSNTAKVLGK